MDWATLWRGCWVHLPDLGSLGYCGFGMRLWNFSTGFSVGEVTEFKILEGWINAESTESVHAIMVIKDRFEFARCVKYWLRALFGLMH